MLNSLRLFHQYVIRDLMRNRLRAVLTASAVALGIGVVVAVQLANARALVAFNDSLQALAGQADLQISANGLPLPESLITDLAWIWDYGTMSPLVQGRGVLGGVEGRPVQLVGVDLLSEAAFRQYVLADRTELTDRISRDEFIDLLVDPRKVIVSGTLARVLSLSKNATVQILIGDRSERFTVGVVLADEAAARAFSGQVVFLDIAAAQIALGKVGLLDRIDVRLRDRSDVDRVRKRIEALLPSSAIVDAPESNALQHEKLSRAFRYNLTALSYIALIVGVILIHNTLSLSVVRRRSEIGMLRAMGASRRLIASLFLSEAACFGAVGVGAGIAVGEFMSRAAGALVSRTIETLYSGVAVNAEAVVSPNLYLEIGALGVLLSIASGVTPAIRATAVSPAAVLREGVVSAARLRPPIGLAAAGFVLIAAAVLVAVQPPIWGFPYLGYAAALLLLVGFGLLTPAFARLLGAILQKPIEAILPVEGRLAMQSIRSSLGRIVSAVLSLGVAVAMLISVVTMVSSFRDTVVIWINQTLRADLYIRAGAAGPNDWSNAFDPGTVETLANLPEIAAVERFRGRAIQFNGTPIVIGGSDFGVRGRYSDLLFIDGRSAEEVAPRMKDQDRVVVSEPLAIKQGVARGDIVRLPTADGLHPFEIEAVYYDYSNDRGLVVMDRSTYVRLFHDASVTNIAAYLKSGVETSEAQRQIARALPAAGLRVVANADLKRQVLQAFDQTFQITYALEVIALVAAIFGITNTLAGLILERRQEFAMLRFTGADRRQLRRMVVVESGLIGVVGAAAGLILGIGLSVILVFVINKQSFGWTIQFALPWWFFIQSLSVIIVTTLIAGLYPASLATRLDPMQSIRVE